MDDDHLWQVHAPWFCAGLVTRGEKVVAAAPILRSLGMGRTRASARQVAIRRGFAIRYVATNKQVAAHGSVPIT